VVTIGGGEEEKDLLTEEKATSERLTHEEREPRLCRVGSSTDNPCWRPATERRWTTDEEPTLCPEHLMELEAGEDAAYWIRVLDKVDEWIRGVVADEPAGDLQRLAYNMRDEARRKYARASREHLAAKLVADAPRGEGQSVSPEANEELSARIMHADALANARTIFEDLPEGLLETVLKGVDKWLIIDALDTATTEASEEAERYKREARLSAD
jgi:hypothetical protein